MWSPCPASAQVGVCDIAPLPGARRSPLGSDQKRSKGTWRDVLLIFYSVPGTGRARRVRAKAEGSKVQKSLSYPRWNLWPWKMSVWCCTHAKQLLGEVASLALALSCSRHTHGSFPSFPGTVELTKTTFCVPACPAEACGGMIMAVRLVKV